MVLERNCLHMKVYTALKLLSVTMIEARVPITSELAFDIEGNGFQECPFTTARHTNDEDL